MEFKDRLKYLRKTHKKDGKKVTQETLGGILGYRYTSISNYESGRNEPCIRDLIKIAKFFDVSLDYLVCATDDNSATEKNGELYRACCRFSAQEQENLITILNEIALFKKNK